MALATTIREKRAIWRRDGLCIHCGKARDNETQSCSRCRATNKRWWYSFTEDQRRAKNRANRIKRKIKVFEAYGGCRCICCGETQLDFLTLDHINNDGKEDRKNTGFGQKAYLYYIKHGFPTGLQVMCFNCNQSKRISGICVHKQIQLRITL